MSCESFSRHHHRFPPRGVPPTGWSQPNLSPVPDPGRIANNRTGQAECFGGEAWLPLTCRVQSSSVRRATQISPTHPPLPSLRACPPGCAPGSSRLKCTVTDPVACPPIPGGLHIPLVPTAGEGRLAIRKLSRYAALFMFATASRPPPLWQLSTPRYSKGFPRSGDRRNKLRRRASAASCSF